jgi:plasmid stabilization system protein ParE
MRLRFTLRALADLIAIADYLRVRNPAAATSVRDSILSSLQILLDFPEIGRRQRTEGVRKLVTGKYRYIVYYSRDIAAEEIVILTIQHPARLREHTDA